MNTNREKPAAPQGGTVIITGGNAGLGFEAAKKIAADSGGWHIVIASRSMQRMEPAVQTLIRETGSRHITAMTLDLASLDSVRRFADRFASAGLPPLRAIICNAGSNFAQETRATDDGVEATFGVNHLGHFLLVRLLLGQLEEGGQVLVVSSDTHDPSAKTGMPAPRYEHPEIMADPAASDRQLAQLSPAQRGSVRYTTSKLCNLYFAYELDRRLRRAGRAVIVTAFNPGMMPGKGSALSRNFPPILRFAWNYVMPALRLFNSAVRSTKQSGGDLAELLLKHLPVEHSGTYWDGPRAIPSSDESYEEPRAKELWNWSSARTGLPAEL
ncbi:SDR family NAD(P)-dependent oxidoreductase [Saccharibacillus sp. CPCC 101409]|uniref:SDR family NAD(P)-dependent oxidoreductase n=1 Tax=Saccharibacillus sp. CPCC 101409 TaxID=3058041 RepID=UPI0026727A31|nr:SDR family NAD(P)-dependent oxidoreductase [Saccharibacillus sp. CPCC 101409]MDO3409832.1 SDR family NAD(P)-dependent oxidoreductase [Saccharibacillus sp. CPCC 101409]